MNIFDRPPFQNDAEDPDGSSAEFRFYAQLLLIAIAVGFFLKWLFRVR